MTTPTPENTYHRFITGVQDVVHDEAQMGRVLVDVYDVLDAYDVKCPALQHLVKKALCAGLRGHKDAEQDLLDIISSAQAALRLFYNRKLGAQDGAAPVENEPVEAAPVENEPVEAAPVEAAPVEAAPVEAAPVEAAPALPEGAIAYLENKGRVPSRVWLKVQGGRFYYRRSTSTTWHPLNGFKGEPLAAARCFWPDVEDVSLYRLAVPSQLRCDTNN